MVAGICIIFCLSMMLVRGGGRDYFPLTLSLSPNGGEGIRGNLFSALVIR
jgi:hypothetical protein